MAQFDVHRNTGPMRHAVPYVVVVQSERFHDKATRVVVPLIAVAAPPGIEERLQPAFEIEGRVVRLDPFQMAAVRLERLGDVVTSLAGQGDAVLDSVDLMLTRAYG